MTVLMIYAVQVAIFAAVPFYLARQSKPLRSVSFYIYLSLQVILGGFLGSVYSFPLSDSISISAGNLLYGAFMMTTILFVIIEKDVGVMRRIIRLVISVNIFAVVVFSSISWALKNQGITNSFNTASGVFSLSLEISALGGVLILAELVFLIYLFEKIKARVSNVIAISLLYISAFILVLCLDGFLFPVIAFPFNPHLQGIVVGGVFGKFVMAVSFSIPMLLFLLVYRKRLVEFIRQPLYLRELLAAPRERLIEEIQRKHESLLQSDQRFRSLAESINDVFFSFNANMRCTYWNKASEESGFLAEEAIGSHLYDLFPDRRHSRVSAFYKEILRTGQANQMVEQVMLKGQERYYEISAYPFVGGVSVIARDITQRKEMEAQLLQSQRMESIGQLAGGIAHDFNNILVPITANAELGMMQLEPDDKLYVYLKRIREAAEQAAGLTRQILAFSRKQVLEMSVLDLNLVMDDFKKMIRHLIGEHIELQIVLEPKLLPVYADKGQIDQVLLNLVVNARDAMPKGGTLTIRTANVTLEPPYDKEHVALQPPGNYSMLSVSDTGHGMDPDTINQIFEPFFTTKPQGEGTGLGLATVFGIVKQHEGNIRVNSVRGKGTTFRVYLPHAACTLQLNDSALAEQESSTGSETILVVEDEQMVRNIVCEALEVHGYNVIEAVSSTDGLRLAMENKHIDLLLTDVVMPQMNGQELYREVLEVQPGIKVLFMSGYTDDIVVNQGMMNESINFIQKPFSVKYLIDKVRFSLIEFDNPQEDGAELEKL